MNQLALVLIQPLVGLAVLAAAAAIAAIGVVTVRRRSATNCPPAEIANVDLAIESSRFRRLRRRYRLLLGAEALSVGIVAVAAVGLVMRPATEQRTDESKRVRDVMLCLDVSGSMATIDAEIVDTFADLATGLEGERIGMTIWNSSPVSLLPLTDDYAFVQEVLTDAGDRLDSSDLDFTQGTFEGDGTSLIGDGLASCVMRFDRLDETRARSIVLATDNEVSGNQIVTLSQAAAYAADKEITVYAIAPNDFQLDGSNTPELEELAAAAESTGGAMFELTDDATVDAVIADINEREGTDIDLPPTVTRDDRPHRLLAVALAGVALSLGVTWVVRR